MPRSCVVLCGKQHPIYIWRQRVAVRASCSAKQNRIRSSFCHWLKWITLKEFYFAKIKLSQNATQPPFFLFGFRLSYLCQHNLLMEFKVLPGKHLQQQGLWRFLIEIDFPSHPRRANARNISFRISSYYQTQLINHIFLKYSPPT